MKNLTGILAVFMILAVGLACSGGDETAKANELVAEANKFLTEANNSAEKVKTKGAEFDQKVNAIKNDTGLKEARDFGKELFPLYDSMKENFQKAGEKFEAASKLPVNAKFKEYLETKAQEMKKRSEYSGELRAVPQALIDSEGEKAYREAVGKISEKVKKMIGEAQQLGDKADKIQKDNPDVMKQS
jgi:hypothetical protein